MNDQVYTSDLLRRTLDALRDLLAAELDAAARGEGKVLVQKPIPEILRELDFRRLVSQGGGDIPALVRQVIANSNRLRHPRYMGHQVAIPMLPSTMADLVSGFLNNGMAVYEMGPAGTAIEKGIVGWMLEKVGWPQGDGVLVHGGSLGNLSGLLAARARVLPDSWSGGVPAGCVVLVSEVAHYSVERAAAILGLGANAVVKVPVDERLRMHVPSLEGLCRDQATAGKRVVAVVANAGTTPNGAYDPLREIGALCRRLGLWLHVDGCQGASALVSPRHRALLDGIELADSLAWDTHKLLATSALCCAVLVREASSLAGTYEQDAPYLFGDEERPGEDLSHKTFECTKALISLKLFFNLAVVGEAGMAAHVERLMGNARRFHDVLAARRGFECFEVPPGIILLFRYGRDSYGRDSRLQDRIRERLVSEGDFYITRTTVRGEAWLRLTLMNPATSDSDISALADRIESLATAM